LEKAEQTFLAVRGLTGETDEYRVNLAQVYYWLGKHQEGRKLFDQVLEARQRDTKAVIGVARLLREVGEASAARTLAEEAYGKESDPRLKFEAAGERAVMPLDVDDQITWLGRADPKDAEVKALLSAAQGHRAIREGKEREALSFFRDALAAYDKQPESSAMLNNSASVCLSLYHLAGDRRDFDQYVSRLEKALTRDPSNAVLLNNVAVAHLQNGLWDVLGSTLDLGALQMTPSVGLLSYVCQDEAGRARLVERVVANPKIAKAKAYFERFLLIAPKAAHGYSSLASLLEFVGDRKGLSALLVQLEGIELDLADSKRRTMEYYAGTRDAQNQMAMKSTVMQQETIVQKLQGKSGPTFAAAASALSGWWINGDEFGIPIDVDAVVRVAEEAHAASPSEGTYRALEQALSFRLYRKLTRNGGAFGRANPRAKRAGTPPEELAAVLEGNPSRREAIFAEPDFKRLQGIMLECDHKFPEHPSPACWALLRSANPDRAADMAKRIRADQVGGLTRAIALRVSPLDVSNALAWYWQQQIAGKEPEGREVRKRLRDQGVPVPLEVK
jgi:tetratricopeptide (TPR) repeat protein